MLRRRHGDPLSRPATRGRKRFSRPRDKRRVGAAANLPLATLVASEGRGATDYERDRLPNAKSSPNRPSAQRHSIMIATLGKNQLRSAVMKRQSEVAKLFARPRVEKIRPWHRLLRIERRGQIDGTAVKPPRRVMNSCRFDALGRLPQAPPIDDGRTRSTTTSRSCPQHRLLLRL